MIQKKYPRFQKLARAVAREYEEKGYSKRESELIGIETAAKVHREQMARGKHKPIHW